jgi:hypothetical protein
VVTCPLAPDVPHLLSGSYSSPRAFGLGFLLTSPRDDAPGSGPGQALALFTRLWRAPSLGPGPSTLLRINSLGVGTLTPQVLCHARHTRPSSPAADGKRSAAVDGPVQLVVGPLTFRPQGLLCLRFDSRIQLHVFLFARPKSRPAPRVHVLAKSRTQPTKGVHDLGMPVLSLSLLL